MDVSNEGEARARKWAEGGARTARQVAHYGALTVTLAAPLAIGGGLPWVQVALAAGAVVTGTAWLLSRRREVKWPPFTGVAALALACTLFQVVPLPAGFVDLISSRAVELRADALGTRPALLAISLDVPATLLAAARGFTCLVVLVVTAHATSRGKGLFFAFPLITTAALTALLAFGQRLAGADTILGLYKVMHMPGSGFFGTFVNGNHAASFFIVGAVLGFGCARETDGWPRTLLAIASVLCVAGLFSTGSRFGLIGLAAAAFMLLTLWLMRNFGMLRGLLATAAAALIAAPLAVALALGQRGRWGIVESSQALNDFKIRGWADALRLSVHYPFTGVGRGAFEAPATAYREHVEHVRLVFPENLFLQFLTEWGYPLTILLCALFVLSSWPMVRRLPHWEPLFQAAASAFVGIVVHDFADFGLEVLGVALPAAMVLGICAGRRQMTLDASDRGRRTTGGATEPGFFRNTVHPTIRVVAASGAVATGTAITAGAAWAASRTGDADAIAIRATIDRRDPTTDAKLEAAIARHPADHDFALLAARWAMRESPPPLSALKQLNRAQRLFPASYAPHVLTGHFLLRLGRRSQAAIEFRLANELGANLSYEHLERLLGPALLERAVPRNPERLFNLAKYFVSVGRAREAQVACARAVVFAENSESSLMRQAEIAISTGDKAFISEAAAALARAPTSAEAFALAARALAAGGQLNEARELVRRAAVMLPQETNLSMKGARIMLEHGDFASARELILDAARRNISFSDRIASEELLAEIADKQGDPHAAAAARARARILVQARNESTGRTEPAGR